jgi:membrane protein
MFLFIYKFASLNRISWRTASLAALVAAIGFELLKAGFGWWVVSYADYSSFFFAFATLVVIVLSVYYGSALFVLGGEVAQVAELRRTLRRQRELFEEA